MIALIGKQVEEIMKIVKCSASSIGTYNHCQFSYFMNYILQMKSKSGKAALQGTIVHQVFEWMIKLKKRGKTNVDPMWLLHRSWDEHVADNPEVEIRKTTTRIDKNTGDFKEAADFKKCRIALESILEDKYYNPYLIDVIDSEQWFSIAMPGDEWTCYDSDKNPHQFAVRGFIDFVRQIDEDTIEIIDWKTGKRQNFHTQNEIDEISLMNEIQPRLYHLAVCYLYPKYKNVIITFYYTNDGGPITISLSQEDLVITIAMLHKFMTTVLKDTLIQRNRSWSCRMCSFNKNDICQRVWSDLHTLGSEYVYHKYSSLSFGDQQKTSTKETPCV